MSVNSQKAFKAVCLDRRNLLSFTLKWRFQRIFFAAQCLFISHQLRCGMGLERQLGSGNVGQVGHWKPTGLSMRGLGQLGSVSSLSSVSKVSSRSFSSTPSASHTELWLFLMVPQLWWAGEGMGVRPSSGSSRTEAIKS